MPVIVRITNGKIIHNVDIILSVRSLEEAASAIPFKASFLSESLTFTAGVSSLCPQFMQKAAPSSTLPPQFEQNSVPTVRLEGHALY